MNYIDIPEGLLYMPRYVKQESDMEYGSVVTHENYNEKLNLNTSQGDYNTEVLNLLFTESDPAKVPHIPYLEKVVDESVGMIKDLHLGYDDRIKANEQGIIDLHTEDETINNRITNIITGYTKVHSATYADNIKGIEHVDAHKYYGTNYEGRIGFHEVPDAVYLEDIGQNVDVAGVYYKPDLNSIGEEYLTESVRTKLNRVSITDYPDLTNLPSIAGVTLTGNKTLAALGIQPAGNYLTAIPDTYALKTYVDSAVSPKLNTSTASSTYAKITTVNDLTTTVANNKSYAEGRYARVCINGFTGTPKTGDIRIDL